MNDIKAGFLIVRTFEDLYRQFAVRLKEEWPFYAIPRSNMTATQMPKKYRGINRNPLIGLESGGPLDLWWKEQGVMAATDPAAQQRLHELEEHDKSDNGFIFSLADAQSVYNLLERPSQSEIIWARNCGSAVDRSHVGPTLGFEPTWFRGDQFSALSDCMCFPRWHGTDRGGTLFADYFARLNEHALFDSSQQAEEFLRFYLSHGWTEQGDYTITEICLPEQESR